jgi:hypothetical protein
MERYANQQRRHIPSVSGWGNATRAQNEKQQESIIPATNYLEKVLNSTSRPMWASRPATCCQAVPSGEWPIKWRCRTLPAGSPAGAVSVREPRFTAGIGTRPLP